jgi:hypothetical protein
MHQEWHGTFITLREALLGLPMAKGQGRHYRARILAAGKLSIFTHSARGISLIHDLGLRRAINQPNVASVMA